MNFIFQPTLRQAMMFTTENFRISIVNENYSSSCSSISSFEFISLEDIRPNLQLTGIKNHSNSQAPSSLEGPFNNGTENVLGNSYFPKIPHYTIPPGCRHIPLLLSQMSLPPPVGKFQLHPFTHSPFPSATNFHLPLRDPSPSFY